MRKVLPFNINPNRLTETTYESPSHVILATESFPLTPAAPYSLSWTSSGTSLGPGRTSGLSAIRCRGASLVVR